MAARYLTLNLALAAVLSVSPALASGYPVTELQLQDRTRVMRTTSGAAQQIKLSWSTDQTINMVALWYTNVSTSGATIRVQRFSDSAFTTSIADTGTVNAFPYSGISANAQTNSDEFRVYKNISQYLSTLTNVRSMIITITDTSNVFGYFEASHLFVGKYVEFAQQFTWGGMKFRPANTTINERADDVSIISDKGGNYVVLELNHDEVQEADWEELATLLSEAAGDRLIWMSLYPGDGTSKEMRNQHAGKIMAASGIDAYLYKTHRASMTFESN